MTDRPVTVVAVLTAKPGMGDRVVEGFRQIIPLVHEEQGCLRYALHQQQGAGDTIVMVEQWASVAELDAHGAGAALIRLNELNRGLLAAPAVVHRLDAVPAGDPDKGAVPLPDH